MKINAKITILVSGDACTIEVHDDDSAIDFLTITLTPEQFTAALGRLGRTSCFDAEVRGLDKVGMKHECRHFDFPLPKGTKHRDKAAARKAADKHCPEGWQSDDYFDSQDSFFTQKNGTEWARVVIRRWIPKEDHT